MARELNEVGEVFRLGYNKFKQGKQLPMQIMKVAKDIIECRTSKLGGHKLTCSECGDEKICYNSCKNRHCPKCQFSKREQWILDRNRDLLPVLYYHVIFTVPHEFNGLHIKYPKSMYDLLFKTTWEAITATVQGQYNNTGQLGMIAVLHSWGQNLNLHPHLHCILPSGVYDRNNQKWIGPKKYNFLCSIEKLTDTFKNKYIDALIILKRDGYIQMDEVRWTKMLDLINAKVFNVNIRPAFSNPDHVIEYLGRYSHRVAITNSRIVNITDDNVSFKYKDYRDDQEKIMTVPLQEFIRRFVLHILPSGFMKIRHYGILSNKVKNEYIENILQILMSKRKPKEKFDLIKYFLEKLDEDLNLCDNCKHKRQQIKEQLPKARSDPDHFLAA